MKLLFIMVFSAISSFAVAQNIISANAVLTHATVYYGKGAELEQQAKLALVAGSQKVILNGISQSVDVNTIQVACPENVSILSYMHRLYAAPGKPVEDGVIDRMQDSIRLLLNQVAVIDNDYSTQNEILSKTAALIESNVTGEPEKSILSAELIKLIDYYSQKIETIKSTLFLLSLKKQSINDSIQQINIRLSARKTLLTPPVAKTIGQLVMQVMAKTAGNTDFSVSYFTAQAGWLPAYDIRVKSIDNSLKLVYKATVQQSTGIDWKQVKLSLNTGNPNQLTASPKINPWFVTLYVPKLAKTLSEVVVTGYAPRRAPMINLDANGNYEADTNDNPPYDDKKLEGNLVAAYTSLSESQLNVNFDIDLPYDIMADGKPVSVGLRDEKINAGYKHYSIPKLDKDAFLLAEISNWESLNLMPGEANIIMDNVYLGKSFIDPNTTADTLTISLGRDKRIAVSRVLVKEFSKSKVRGDTKTDAFTYEIVVKNNKTKTVDLVLMDQYPVSKIKEVEVTLTENGQAIVDDEKGMLSWKIKLEPGESRKIRFGYMINYSKDKKLTYL